MDFPPPLHSNLLPLPWNNSEPLSFTAQTPLQSANMQPFPAGIVCCLQSPDLGSHCFLLISSALASRRDDLNQCSEAKIPGKEVGRDFLSKRKVCGQSGWESSGCVLELAELAGKGGGDACWDGLERRFPLSRDLLLNRSRADVLVVGEMRELGTLQL